MSDISQALSDLELTIRVRRDYASVDSYQKAMQNRHTRWHQMAYPLNGDQWPGDVTARPNKLHYTHNRIQPVILTDTTIESKLPRIMLDPDTISPADRQKAEQAEKLVLKWLDYSDWSTWAPEACQCKATYGKTILKPYWNEEDKRPDVSVIEQPSLLRFGYGSSDYKYIDWALYEYSISPFEAMRRFPELDIPPPIRGKITVNRITNADHGDPLGQRNPNGPISPSLTMNKYLTSDYEGKQVRCWDYWYKDAENNVHQAYFVEEQLAKAPTAYPEYPAIPFIVIEHDHEPGSPEGIGEVERLWDNQIEYNRAMSHMLQLILDEVDPAWEINSDSAPPGVVPRGGDVIATGSENAHFKAIEKPINLFPITEALSELKEGLHFETGIPDIMFGKAAGAQTAGRALQIQTSSTGNRLDTRRERFYKGVRTLIAFWSYMAIKKNVSFVVGMSEEGPNGEPGEPIKATYKDILGDFKHWKTEAPEITPRDDQELTGSTISLLNAKLISVEEAMDRMGVKSPLEMMEKIEKERLNPKYFPGDAQAYVAVLALIQQYQAQQGAGPEGVPAQGSPNADAAPGGNSGEALPPEGPQGENGSGVPGSAPPAPGGLGTNQSLIRGQSATGGAQVLQQTKTTY